MSKKRNWTPLVRTQYALGHHAKKIKPVADALLYALAGSGLTYHFDHSSTGSNSWYVDVIGTSGSRRFYLRSRQNPWRIDVNDRYFNPKTLASMGNERDVLRVVTQMVDGTI